MLDPSLAEFLQQGLSIHLGTRNARLEPHGARVVAARVEAGDGTDAIVTAYVPVTGSEDVLADLSSNGQVALACSRPSDDRACQLKGVFLDQRPAQPSELDTVHAQWNAFVGQLGMVGIPAQAAVGWVTWPCIALRFRVTAVFDQTPATQLRPLTGDLPAGDIQSPPVQADRLQPPLATLAPCFQGIIPAMFFTCSADGVPNVAYLSHVEYVDPAHVALSFQFFNKSRRNIVENPQALVHMLDPDTAQGWALRLWFSRSETSGPLFSRMALRIEAIASYTGLKGIFKLLAADVFRVTQVSSLSADRGHDPEPGATARRALPSSLFTLTALQDLVQRINTTSTLDDLLESILAGVEEFFGFRHSMILLTADEPGVLVTIASRGYDDAGVGAEARFGEGIAGVVAEAQKPLRISGLLRGMLYAASVRRRAEAGGWASASADVPMPGLASPDSQLGIPLVVRGELLGVLVLESESAYRFHEEDKNAIELLGSYLAIAIQNCQLQEAADADEDVDAPPAPPAAAGDSANACQLAFHVSEEVVLIDGEYLIRGLPARILWKLLVIHQREGRSEFTNRELRLDKSLGLPEFKDNLETRLLLLRRRLEQKTPVIQIQPSGRGRFTLTTRATLQLETR
jgi:hypothetical protein